MTVRNLFAICDKCDKDAERVPNEQTVNRFVCACGEVWTIRLSSDAYVSERVPEVLPVTGETGPVELVGRVTHCTCEHQDHFDGGPGHPYQAIKAGVVPLVCEWGTWDRCRECQNAGHMVN